MAELKRELNFELSCYLQKLLFFKRNTQYIFAYIERRIYFEKESFHTLLIKNESCGSYPLFCIEIRINKIKMAMIEKNSKY